jgi:hypothetical protein
MEWERQQHEANEANAQALREQQACETHAREQAAERQRILDMSMENRILVETQVVAAEAHK